MTFIKRIELFGYTGYFRLGKRVSVEGVNSQVGLGESVLFWDMDTKDIRAVTSSLRMAQYAHELSKIYVFHSSTNGGFHAVCMTIRPWLECLSIVAGTPDVDPLYVKLAAQREHFTLRLTDKGQGEPVLNQILESVIPEDATIESFVQGVRYNAWVR